MLCAAVAARFSIAARAASGVRFTKSHEWVKVEGNKGTVGLTQHARDSLGDIVFCEIPQAGKTVKAGEAISVVESVKSVSDVYSPMSGEVIVGNDALGKDLGLINRTPETDGWIAKIKLTKLDEFDTLLTPEQYAKHCEEDHH
eukprot:m51a1_g3359 putative glycine cleavage system protein h (143) ;mRNA; f:436020-436844